MKSKFSLVWAIIIINICLATMVSYFLLTSKGIINWDWYHFTPAAGLSLFLIITSIRDIIKYKRSK